jgi:hypothetical protein
MADINTNPLAGKIAVLAANDLKRLTELLNDRKWQAALDLLNAIDADAKAVSRSCTHLASAVNKRHWSPLFEQEDSHG